MKKVVKQQTETISIDQITDASIIGIEWESGLRGIVVYSDKGFSILNFNSKSILEAYQSDKMKTYVSRALGLNCGIWSFESVKECLKWISE